MKAHLLVISTFLIWSCWGCGNGPKDLPENFSFIEGFSLTTKLKLGSDIGQSLGTIFEIRDKNDRLIAGAGFFDGYSYKIRNNNRVLSFFICNLSYSKKISTIVKPYKNIPRSRLMNVDNNLVATLPAYSGVPKVYNFKTKSWKRWKEVKKTAQDNLYYVQIVNNKKLMFYEHYVEYGGGEVFRDDDCYNNYLYVNGKFYIFQKPKQGGATRVLVFDWNPDNNVREDHSSKTFLPLPEFGGKRAYIMFPFNEEVIIGTNYGNIYRIKDDKLSYIRKINFSDNYTWQPYSIMRWYDKLFIGQFPSGNIFIYNGRELTPMKPPVPVIEGASKKNREAMTMLVYRGNYYAGIWPWGELWGWEDNDWSLVGRLFTDPPVTKDITPFHRETDNSFLGQRVINLITLGSAMYAATSSRTGKIDEDAYFKDILAQYGAVHRIEMDHQISSQIFWKDITTFGFELTGKSLIIKQDNRILYEKELQQAVDIPAGPYKIVMADGLYGPFAGSVLHTTLH